jgi:hypothetical protein
VHNVDVIRVLWRDSYFDFEGDGAARPDCLVTTVGHLVADGPIFLSIAGERLPDGTFRAITGQDHDRNLDGGAHFDRRAFAIGASTLRSDGLAWEACLAFFCRPEYRLGATARRQLWTAVLLVELLAS